MRNLHVSALASPKAITMLYEVKPGERPLVVSSPFYSVLSTYVHTVCVHALILPPYSIPCVRVRTLSLSPHTPPLIPHPLSSSLFLSGPCLESYGIHVARMANFPEAVIEEALRKAKELEGIGAFGV